ncbi:MAG: hypothetical protein KA519_09850 [Bacteroides sp.]|uniref:hypothetical protein n=1 Tax=Bacteroides sp. TaxID=29523 RepID=UPI001B4B63E2|nr:hypothetical protein [Bacteroides sp.]MBP6068357.1 hypothetical protein [Bacteroides sp.]MBP7612968.1 hypothetical protein [Paludibacter sp.]
MQKVTNNPYRIAGILANSSGKDILKQKSKIDRFSEVGKEITSEYDFSFFPQLQRNNNIVAKAFSDIQQNQDRIIHSLFWFINTNTIDDTAIQYLISGNKEKAFEIWEKITEEKEINSKNFSAFNNIGTLYLLNESRDQLKQGITIKIKLIESKDFKNFINTVADETFTIDASKQVERFVDELLIQIKNDYSIADTINLFSGCNSITQKYISQKLTEEPIHKIETQIEQTKDKRIKDKDSALRFGTDLQKNTNKELVLLKSILGVTNLQYKMLADNVAKEILQCSIDYFNESQEQGKSNNYLEEAMALAKSADGIAVNKITKDRIKDNINTLEEMKEQELDQAIELLKSIKGAYEQACRQIDKQVDDLQYDTKPSFIGDKQMRMRRYDISIDWSKVEYMKRNALAWDKVVVLIKEAIPPPNVLKIKLSEKQSKITEYKSLVDFLLSKLDDSQVNQLKYLCYWKNISTTQSTTVKSTGSYKPTSTSTNTSENSWAQENPGCWIAIIFGVVIFLIFLFN